MKIGILQTYFAASGPGGGEVHTTQLSRALRRRGHDVTICTDVATSRRSDIDDLTVREFETPVKANPITELTLGYKARRELSRCDVVVLTDESGWTGVEVGVPTVMVFHLVWHGWIARHGPTWQVLRDKPQAYLYRWLETKIATDCSAIVAISENMREDIGRIGSFNEKTHAIPNGVDTERFSPTDDRYEGFTVHFQGRLVEMKNPGLLIRACANSTAAWRVTIGGDGPLRADLESLAERLDVADRVEFLGYVPDAELPGRYARSDVYVLPSTYEGMPLTVLEAAAAGTPVVASERAATTFVTDEIGRVVETTASDIAATIDELCRNPEQTAALGRAARAKAQSYSWDAIAEQYESLFESLIERD